MCCAVFLFLLNRKVKDWLSAVGLLVAADLLSWILLFIARLYFAIDVSRRLTNLPYYFWMIGHNLQFLAIYLAVELIQVAILVSQKMKTPKTSNTTTTGKWSSHYF